MDLHMDKSEIVMRYNEAKDKKEQINILSEMNLVPRAAIVEVLKNAGAELPGEFRDGNWCPAKKGRMTWDEKAIAELKRLKKEGFTHLEIAERMGASKLSVDRMVQKAGLSKPRSEKKHKAESTKDILTETKSDVDRQYIKILEEQLKGSSLEADKLRKLLGAEKKKREELEAAFPSSEDAKFYEDVLNEARVIKGLAHLSLCALKRIKNVCGVGILDLVDGILVSCAQIAMSAESILDVKEKRPTV